MYKNASCTWYLHWSGHYSGKSPLQSSYHPHVTLFKIEHPGKKNLTGPAWVTHSNPGSSITGSHVFAYKILVLYCGQDEVIPYVLCTNKLYSFVTVTSIIPLLFISHSSLSFIFRSYRFPFLNNSCIIVLLSYLVNP